MVTPEGRGFSPAVKPRKPGALASEAALSDDSPIFLRRLLATANNGAPPANQILILPKYIAARLNFRAAYWFRHVEPGVGREARAFELDCGVGNLEIVVEHFMDLRQDFFAF